MLTEAREGAVASAGGDLVAESYEVALSERISVPAAGAPVRMVRLQIESARVEDGLAFLREEMLPRLNTDAGLHSAEVMIDRSLGSGVFLTVWADENSSALADTTLEQLRDMALERVGDQVPPDRELRGGAGLRAAGLRGSRPACSPTRT